MRLPKFSTALFYTFLILILMILMAGIHAFSASQDRAKRVLRNEGLVEVQVAKQYAYIGSCGWKGPVGHSFVGRLRDNTLTVGVVCTDLWLNTVVIYK